MSEENQEQAVPVSEPIPVEEHTNENEQVKDKLAEFGETDLEHFTAKVTSNAVFGRQVVRKLLGLDTEKPFINVEHHTASQESNIVGVLDHSTYPPKVKGAVDGTASKSDAA